MTIEIDGAAFEAGEETCSFSSGRVSADGESTGVHLSEAPGRIYVTARALLRSAIRGGIARPAVLVRVQDSADGVSWASIANFDFSASGKQAVAVDSPREFLRAIWIVTGGTWEIDADVLSLASSSAPGGSQPVLSHSITLTDAQVRALPTTPVVVLSAQGSGILTLAADSSAFPAIITLGATNVAYTNVNAGAVWAFQNQQPGGGWGTGYYAHDGLTYGPSGGGAPVVTICTFATTSTGARPINEGGDDQPLYLAINNAGDGDLAGGDPLNTCKVTIYYALLTV